MAEVENSPPKPMGIIGIVVFEIYFIALGAFTAYFVWRTWQLEENKPFEIWGISLTSALTADGRQMLIASTMGVLGSFIHAATSFTTYLGNRTLVRSWAGWYLLRPLIGMSLGLLFYVILRAGFVTNDPHAVNEYGVAAIAGLAGMFSKQATDKLKEVFDQLFQSKGDEEREDKQTGE